LARGQSLGADRQKEQIVKVGVLGLWHLGSVTAACVAAAGIQTVGVDGDPQVIAALRRSEPPVFEPRLAELISHGLEAGTLSFAADPAALASADVVWICHDTPIDGDDRADISGVCASIESAFPHLRDGAIVLVSAQLPIGTVSNLERAFARTADGRSVEFACSPENLRLGLAVESFRNPSRIVVGLRSSRAREVLSALLGRFCNNLIFTSVESAEMAKHALNAMLAASITITNELAVICERVGADAAEVESALRSDPRIGAHAYVRPGAAFAGGTLARDVRLLSELAGHHHVHAPLIGSVIPSNEAHRAWMIDKLLERLGTLKSRTVAVLGLSSKPGTDVIRRSAAVMLLRALIAEGADVCVFDPVVRSLPPELERNLRVAVDARAAMEGAEAVVIATEWPQFRSLTAEDFRSTMSGNLIIDPGRFLTQAIAAGPGLQLLSVGRAA
jgi:UDPglucose 6-dehydrogenase